MLKVLLTVAGATFGAAVLANGMLAGLKDRQPDKVALAKPEDVRPGQISLGADPDGHFRVEARIGTKTVPMLVDTGATVVALSYEEGRRLGLVSSGDRFEARVSTANGAVGAKRVVLPDVRVGSVKVDGVAAVVLSPGAMDGALLGMSFLGRLRKLETGRGRLLMER